MASPVIATFNSNGDTSAVNPVNILVPSGVQAGDLLIIVLRLAASTVSGTPTGWTQLARSTADASDDELSIWYKKATGSETNEGWFCAGSTKSASVYLRITGAADPTVTAPQISTVATGTSTAPNPTSVTPSAGSKDYLFLWAGGWEGEQTSPPSGSPTNYTAVTGNDSGTGGAVATNCRVAVASRALTTGSAEDPGSWTISVSDDWMAYTICVHPAGASTTTFTPAAIAATAEEIAPALALSIGFSPAAIAAVAEEIAPTLANIYTMAPAAIASPALPVAPSLTTGAIALTPAAIPAVAALPTPGFQSVYTMAPAAVTAIAEEVAPALGLVLTLSPAPIATLGSPVAPGFEKVLTHAPAAIAAILTVPGALVSTGGASPTTFTPAAIAAGTAVVAPTLGLSLSLTPPPVAAVVEEVLPVLGKLLSLMPPPVAVVAEEVAPGLGLSLSFAPAPVAAQVAVPAEVLSLLLSIAPPPVAAVMTAPGAQVVWAQQIGAGPVILVLLPVVPGMENVKLITWDVFSTKPRPRYPWTRNGLRPRS